MTLSRVRDRETDGGPCAMCGVRQAIHRGIRVMSDDVGPHEWFPSPAILRHTQARA